MPRPGPGVSPGGEDTARLLLRLPPRPGAETSTRLRRPFQPRAPRPPGGQGQRGQCGQRGQRDGASGGNAVRVASRRDAAPEAPQRTREPAGRGCRSPLDGGSGGPWREEAVAPERPCCRPAGAGTRSRAEPGLRSRVSGDVRVGPAVWLSRGRLQQGVRGPRQGPARRGHGGPTLHSAERLALGSSFGKSKGDRFCTDTGQARHLGVLPEKERGSVRGGIRKLKTPKGAPAGRGPVWVKVE